MVQLVSVCVKLTAQGYRSKFIVQYGRKCYKSGRCVGAPMRVFLVRILHFLQTLFSLPHCMHYMPLNSCALITVPAGLNTYSQLVIPLLVCLLGIYLLQECFNFNIQSP